MHKVASYTSEPSSSRRCSTETIYSIQGHETDIVRDTTDTEWSSSEENIAAEFEEFEPASESDDKGLISDQSSTTSDREIITTQVVEVGVGDDGLLQFADSEQTRSEDSDSELDYHDYWLCAHCRTENNSPLYRYCEKCFKVRKNFFPPRPKRTRKVKVGSTIITLQPVLALSQDSGVESLANSQDPSPSDKDTQLSQNKENNEIKNEQQGLVRKRRAESADPKNKNKRLKSNYTNSEIVSDSDIISDSDHESKKVSPLVKTASDPALTIENAKVDSVVNTNKMCIIKTTSDPGLTIDSKVDPVNDTSDNLCITCFSGPKSGVFVHGRIAHICCCYKCAVKVWSKTKRCPVCNRKVSNVLKAVVM